MGVFSDIFRRWNYRRPPHTLHGYEDDEELELDRHFRQELEEEDEELEGHEEEELEGHDKGLELEELLEHDEDEELELEGHEEDEELELEGHEEDEEELEDELHFSLAQYPSVCQRS